MSANGKAKLKLLYIRQILEDETDSDHGLTMGQIIERLSAYGIEAERKSVYRDISLLREFGMDIRTYQRSPVEYGLARRGFDLSELMLLVDAVETSRFLTVRQARQLVTNIKLLASDSQRERLDRRIHVAGRIRRKNESVFGSIDCIHKALRDRKKIEFMYFKHDVDGQKILMHGGKPHVVTPVAISYDEGFYYLTAWNDKYEGFTEFRVDRMEKLKVSLQDATRNRQISDYTYDEGAYQYFGRFGGEETTCTLHVDAANVEIILDRFGDAARLSRIDEGTAQAVVRIHKSPQFFGWIAGMGGAVRIAAPNSLCEEYRAYLQNLIEEAR